jgi:hypothetical protein
MYVQVLLAVVLNDIRCEHYLLGTIGYPELLHDQQVDFDFHAL